MSDTPTAVQWVCDGGHHGASTTLPAICPLVVCSLPVTAYGPGSRDANAKQGAS